MRSTLRCFGALIWRYQASCVKNSLNSLLHLQYKLVNLSLSYLPPLILYHFCKLIFCFITVLAYALLKHMPNCFNNRKIKRIGAVLIVLNFVLILKGNNLISSQLVFICRITILLKNKLFFCFWVLFFMSLKLREVGSFKNLNIGIYSKISCSFIILVKIKIWLKIPPNCGPVM